MIVTTRIYCERGIVVGGVRWVEGSMVVREYEGIWFLIGILRLVFIDEYGRAFFFIKVFRYSLWFR